MKLELDLPEVDYKEEIRYKRTLDQEGNEET